MGHSARTCKMNTKLCFAILRADDPRDVGMWGRIILKWVVKEHDISVWTGFSWLGIVSAGRSNDFGNVRSGCNSPLPAGKLSASGGGPCTMHAVCPRCIWAHGNVQ
jgi:hypothetical protein